MSIWMFRLYFGIVKDVWKDFQCAWDKSEKVGYGFLLFGTPIICGAFTVMWAYPCLLIVLEMLK